MKDIFDAPLILGLSARHIIGMLSGVLLIASPFLLWTSFSDNGVSRSLDGFDLEREANTLFVILLPLAGFAALLGSFILSRFPELRGHRLVVTLGVLTGIIALLSLCLSTVQIDFWMRSKLGTSFLNNAMPGWYASLIGSLLLIFAAVLPRARELFPEGE